MIQNVLRSIGGVGVYGVISISIFFAVFTGMLIWAFSIKKPLLAAMGEMPLNDGSETQVLKGENHHE